MAEKAVAETFAALFALIDLRQIFRDTNPTYQFTNDQREQIKRAIEQVRNSVDIIEGELME